MSVIDELFVHEGESVELRIIPPDSLSTESDVLVICPWDSQPGVEIVRTDLPKIAEAVGAESSIVGITHIGDETYTVRTAEGGFLEVDGNSKPLFLRSIRRIAALVEAKAFGSQNQLPPKKLRRSHYLIGAPMRNSMRKVHRTNVCPVTDSSLVRSESFRVKAKEKVDRNPFPLTTLRNKVQFRMFGRMGELANAD